MRGLRREFITAAAAAFGFLLVFRHDALGTGAFWDESSFYWPAIHGFMTHGPLALKTPEVNPIIYHPPLYLWFIALVTRCFGWSFQMIRLASFFSSALYIAAAYALARARAGRVISAAMALALAASPVFLSQAGLSQPEIPKSAFMLLSFFFLFKNRVRTASVLHCLGLACNLDLLFVLPAPIWYLMKASGRRSSKRDAKNFAIFIVPVAALLLGWFIAFHFASPEISGIPADSLSRLANPLDLFHRALSRLSQLFGDDGRLPLSLLFVLAWAIAFRKGQLDRIERAPRALALAIGCEWLALSVLGPGGTPAQRYLQLSISLVFVLAAWTAEWLETALPRRYRTLLPLSFALSAIWGSWAWHQPPDGEADPGSRSAYRDQVELIYREVSIIASGPGSPLVLTSWPVSSYFAVPCLQAVTRPIDIVQLGDPDRHRKWVTLAKQRPLYLLVLEGDSYGSAETTEFVWELRNQRENACSVKKLGNQEVLVCEIHVLPG